jgi:hypothetical protein
MMMMTTNNDDKYQSIVSNEEQEAIIINNMYYNDDNEEIVYSMNVSSLIFTIIDYTFTTLVSASLSIIAFYLLGANF